MKTRLIYKIGEHLPKWLRIIYYIITVLSFVYIVYRFLEWLLKTVQKIGYFIFDPKNYWTAVLAVSIIIICTFIAAQFVLGLDPWGNFIHWIVESYENTIGGLINAAA